MVAAVVAWEQEQLVMPCFLVLQKDRQVPPESTDAAEPCHGQESYCQVLALHTLRDSAAVGRTHQVPERKSQVTDLEKQQQQIVVA